MHDVPYGLPIWLGGLLLLIVIVMYVVPRWKARRKRGTPPPRAGTEHEPAEPH